MKNPKTRQPDPVSGTVHHDGVDTPMNDNMGTDDAQLNPEADREKNDSVADALTDSDRPNLKHKP